MEELDQKTREIRAGHRRTAWLFYSGIVLLIFLAAAAPIVGLLKPIMPASETLPAWFQRSGAVTTLFSFLAGALAVVAGGKLHTPGTWGDLNKLAVLEEFKPRFQIVEKSLIALTVLGTVVWGYGDLILRAIVSPA